MNVIESIADRRIRAARTAGLFDNLSGKGKPIPDIDTERSPGWWADRVMRRERSILKSEDLDQVIRSAMPAVWRLETESDVRTEVAQLNKRIDEYNRVTTWDPRARLDVADVVATWREVQARPTR